MNLATQELLEFVVDKGLKIDFDAKMGSDKASGVGIWIRKIEGPPEFWTRTEDSRQKAFRETAISVMAFLGMAHPAGEQK